MKNKIIIFISKSNTLLAYFIGVLSSLSVFGIRGSYIFYGIVGILLSALGLYFINKYKNINDDFEFQLVNSKWNKEVINNKNIWICENNKGLQIEEGGEYQDFKEEWTRKYPDTEGSNKESIFLKSNNVIFKELLWISLDGGRIFVPLPKRKNIDGTLQFFYKKESIELKISNIIGYFDHYDNIEGVCENSGIIIK